ncbi:hypothetical protein C7974DRAFT_153841 [Boeremia exigua]|uniref:uncharacterized protein n=1 Tax=Boeremia exigua TaxID=749465 RepID=UPI001E8E19D5|nr:uncharacterized protein C7974DRAFT_153841 [Boeremia exigua]KAH6638077.1 hypothetical protein C7974DRAFT_153841 [Boeremia exigua]
MLCKASIILAGALALGALAVPIPECPNSQNDNTSTSPDTNTSNPVGSVTADQLIKIAPATASCSGADFPEECVDAATAATALNKSFDTYGIKTAGEKAALIAYTLFESGNFKYSKNHFPGRPGQGTRMMAMPPFVAKYATAVAGADAVATASAAGGDAGLNAVLALVNSDDATSFGSAAWFYSTQCTEAVKTGVAAETIDGWHNFLTVCVGTTLDETRDTPWVAAKAIILG